MRTAVGSTFHCSAASEISVSRAAGSQYDGTQDNTIIAHEWGHYWHHRLVQCGGQQCGGMSEGWGDFVAISMTDDDAAVERALGVALTRPEPPADGATGTPPVPPSVNDGRMIAG